jgi:hypothetical protein
LNIYNPSFNGRRVVMTKIKFYGANDDLIEVEGPVVDPYKGMSLEAEFENQDSRVGPFDFKGAFYIVDASGEPKVRIYAIYDGTWSFAVAMLDEETPIPEGWTFVLRPSTDCDYSMELVAEVDEGCYAMQPNGKEDEE